MSTTWEELVVPLNLALGNEKGNIRFSSDQNCMNHVLGADEVNASEILVNVSTLDDELIDNPFLIKIDVEGYESAVLEGAKDVLMSDSLSAVIMELNGSGNRYGYDENKILTKMHQLGFKTYSYNPFERNLLNLSGKNDEQGNTIFIRKYDEVYERLQKAEQFIINGLSI